MSTDPASTPSAWDQFRAERWEGLAAPYGWLSLTGLHWLTESPTALTDADGTALPGRWFTQNGAAVLEANAADGWTLVADGTPVDGTVRTETTEDGSVLWVQRGSLRIEAGVRDGRWMLRLRDGAADLDRFAPLRTWAPDARWRVPARWEPWESSRRRRIATIRPDTGGWAQLDGELVVELDGDEHRLAGTAGRTSPDGSYEHVTVSFHDRTNGVTSAPWRFLTAPLDAPARAGGGPVSAVADFNRALNYPMAFSPYATCPAPVPENRLSLAVEAGEQAVRG